MKKQHDKLMADLGRLIKMQDLKTEEDVRKFMDSLVGQKIPSFSNEVLNLKEQAIDLVFEAYELTPTEAKENIEQALQLDRDCIEAYEFLGSLERTPELASVFYEKGISIGRRLFGGKYLEDHKGMFWGLHETRPFMRCLQQYADCLYAMGNVNECNALLEEMIELNPNDNQGVRHQLLLYLIQHNKNEKFLKYSKMFEDDGGTFPLFNNALFTFKTEGETENSNKLLLKALKQNKFVAKKLLSNKPITELADHYSIGSKDEAEYYASFAKHIWAETEGAKEWLKKQTTK